MRIWKIPDQVIRLAVVFAVVLAVVVVVRQRFVPASFGELGHYRPEAIDIAASQVPLYAGMLLCGECHTDEAETKSASFHRGLTCEGCHGPSALHLEDPGESVPAVPVGRDPCLRCHGYVPSRPTGFPQVIASFHNPMEPCVTCHDPHDPTPPETPQSCEGCHGAISRIKSVSHHRELDCTTCHDAPVEHRETPHAYLPKKPSRREFCGGCHSVDATSASHIPRVDLSQHGGRYLCWQCHYPHFPEGS